MVSLHKTEMIALAQQSTYKKGPDVMAKSVRTQERYRKAWKNQTNFAQFRFGNLGSSKPQAETSMAGVTSDVRDPGSDDSEAILLGIASQFSHCSSSVNKTYCVASVPPVLPTANDPGYTAMHPGPARAVTHRVCTGHSTDAHPSHATVQQFALAPGDSLPVLSVPQRQRWASQVVAGLQFGGGSCMLCNNANESDSGFDCDSEASIKSVSVGIKTVAESTNTEQVQANRIGADADADSDFGGNTEGEAEEWEDELNDGLTGRPSEIRDWDTLRTQIKADLKKKSQTLPLSRINQLMLLSNFATLRLKGLSHMQASLEIAQQWHKGDGTWFACRVRALAHHYQVFEQLPHEQQGGYRNQWSWLHDETVKKHIQAYLTNLPTGKVTPKRLQIAVNSTIFAKLGLKPAKPISIRTVCRWLLKLGWRHTTVKKGVYMDGHERADVVEYRNNVFLPAMAKFEAHMAQYEGPDLK